MAYDDAQTISSTGLTHEVRDVTPQEASRLLEHVRNQAPLDQRQIAAYARDMSAGAWKLNGDPIILDSGGVVLSGRLRLHAGLRAGCAFLTLIVRNVPPAHFDTIDSLRRRTVSDIMAIRKEKDGRALAASLTVLWRYANDDIENQSKRASSQALLAVLETNPDIRYSIKVAKQASPRLPYGLGAALHYLFSQVDAQKADTFFSELGAVDAGSKGPTELLRKQLEDSYQAGGSRSQVQLAGATIKAWEAYRHERPIALIRYVPGSEQFPKITGLPNRISLDGVKHSTGSVRPTRPGSLSKVSVKLEVVTPQRAQDILSRNDRNRGIAMAVVDKYARDMKAGNWALNGQTIKLGVSGQLLDGQHRCAAAVRANTTFPALIVEGLDDEVFDTFDLGTRRSISSIFKDRGETNTAVLAAVARQVWLLENDLITVKNAPPTVSELVDTLDRHPLIRESVKFAHKVRDIAPSILLALHYFFSKVDRERADHFVERVADGAMLEADSAVLRLRDLMQEDRANRKGRMGDSERAALIIKAWNNYLFNRPTRLLKWSSSGLRKEAFPRISGLDNGEQYAA